MLCVPVEQVGPVGIRAVPVRRSGGRLEDDFVVVEQPLEIRVDGRPVVVTMRTPGHDEELAAGFLYAESIIAGGADVAAVRAVAGEGGGGQAGGTRLASFAGDRVEVTLAAGAAATAASGSAAGGAAEPTAGRAFAATAACGVCGKESIDDLERLNQGLPVVTPDGAAPVPVEQLEALPDRLRAAQALFDATGGIHAAGIFTADGERLCVREDVGRHNAVDKVIGHFVLRNAVPLSDRILVVSGRAGFELVQKALRAAIPTMVSVGAASSLAVEMAAGAGMTLYSFAGRGRGNLHVG